MPPVEQTNAEQRAFIECDAPRILLLAPPGSGKTKSCIGYFTHRIANGLDPAKILAVTFTRKAAAEFRERLSAKTRMPEESFCVETYHSLAADLIGEDPAAFGFSAKPTLVEAGDVRRRLLSRCRHHGLEWDKERFGDIVEVFSLVRNLQRYPESFGRFNLPPTMSSALQDLHAHFLQTNTADYDMLLESVYARLTCDPKYGASLRSRWSHVIVDEMQDTNPLNYQVLRSFNPDHLVCVGDVNQSIYEWRGAKPELVDTFRDESSAVVMRLKTNYRSRQHLLDFANETIKSAPTALTMTSGIGDGGAIWAYSYEDPTAEAEAAAAFIAERIRAGETPGSIAVLARNTRLLKPIERALRQRNVASITYSGSSSKNDPRQTLACFLRAIVNTKDDAAYRHLTDIEAGITSSPPLTDAILQEGRSIPTSALVGRMPDLLQPWLARNLSGGDAKRTLVSIAKLASAHKSKYPGEFLTWLQLEAPESKHPDSAVSLSTIHSAKGLEWNLVWVAGLGQRQFCSQGSTAASHEDLRLLYVAITRAQTQLALSYPRYTLTSDGLAFPQKPLRVIPDALQWQIVRTEEGCRRITQALARTEVVAPKPTTKEGWDALKARRAARGERLI